MPKRCASCGAEKEASEFAAARDRKDGLRPYCKPCSNAKNKQFREANPESAKASTSKWYENNKEKKAAQVKKWAERNKEHHASVSKAWMHANTDKARGYWRKHYQECRKNNPAYKIHNAIGGRIRKCLRGAKASRTETLIGYPITELMASLERQFQPGMRWDNYGEWHIDHIVPLVEFDCSTEESDQIKRAWAIPNLRPIWAEENLRKRCKRLYLL